MMRLPNIALEGDMEYKGNMYSADISTGTLGMSNMILITRSFVVGFTPQCFYKLQPKSDRSDTNTWQFSTVTSQVKIPRA